MINNMKISIFKKINLIKIIINWKMKTVKIWNTNNMLIANK